MTLIRIAEYKNWAAECKAVYVIDADQIDIDEASPNATFPVSCAWGTREDIKNGKRGLISDWSQTMPHMEVTDWAFS